MHKKPLAVLALLLAFGAAHAQTAPAAPAASGKKALVARILKIQQSSIEGMGRTLAERPAIEMMERADAVLASRVPPEKREALAKDIQGDVRKYMDEAVPLVRDRAVRLAPQTIGPLLEAKFSEDELRQLATFLESPAYGKFQQLGGDMQKSLLEKLLADTRPAIEPKVSALDQAIGKRLAAVVPPAAPMK